MYYRRRRITFYKRKVNSNKTDGAIIGSGITDALMAHELCRADYKQLPGLFYTGSPADKRFRNKNMKYGKCGYIIAADEDKKFSDPQRCNSLLRKKAGVPEHKFRKLLPDITFCIIGAQIISNRLQVIEDERSRFFGYERIGK